MSLAPQILRTGAIALLLIPGSVLAAPGDASIATWKSNKAAALTFTVDDGIMGPTEKFRDAFNANGVKGTFSVNNYQAYWTVPWSTLQQLAQQGHEIANHTSSHVAATASNFQTEVVAFASTIQSQVGTSPLTFVYPFGTLDAESLVPGAGYISARGVWDGIEPKTPSDWYNLKTKAVNEGQTASTWNPWVDQALSSGGWCIELWHNVDNAGQYANVSAADMSTHVAYAAAKSNLWIETLAGVTKYVKERNAATVNVSSKATESYTFTVSDNLDNTTFNAPITVKIEVSGWSYASATQNGVAVTASVIQEGSLQYALVDAIPDRGTVIVQQSTSNSTGSSSSSTTASSSSSSIASSSSTASGTTPVDNFEDGDNANNFGGYWYAFTDSANGGKSTVQFSTTGGGYNAGNAATASFRFDKGSYAYSAFIGVGMNWTASTSATDLSQTTGISFYYKGNAARLSFQASNILDYNYYGYDLPAASDWTYVTISWSSMTQSAGWGTSKPLALDQAMALAWQVTGADGTSGSLSIDDVVLQGSAGLQTVAAKVHPTAGIAAASITMISSGIYQIQCASHTEVSLFDTRGHKVRSLSGNNGILMLDLAALGLPHGMYHVRVQGEQSFPVLYAH